MTLVFGVLFVLIYQFYANQAHAGDLARSSAFVQATTSTSFSITSSARVLATTTNTNFDNSSYSRVYATICNANANPVALFLSADAKANLPGGKVTTWVAAAAGYNACYEITDRNLYLGSVQASSTNQTATVVTVADYVQ